MVKFKKNIFFRMESCKYIQKQLDECGAKFGKYSRFFPSNKLDRKYYHSNDQSHCVFYMEAMEACENGAKEQLHNLKQKFLLSKENNRAKFLPANRTRPFFEWFDAGKIQEQVSVLPDE